MKNADSSTPSPKTVPLILGGLLAGACLCYALAFFLFTDGAIHETIRSLGEGLFVAFALATGGDFYLRAKLGEQSVRRGVQAAISQTFGFLGPDQPDELHDAVKTFASARLYMKHATWVAQFDWEDRAEGRLKITLSVRGNCRSLRSEGYLPEAENWVFESVPPFKSRFVRYAPQCPQSSIDINESANALDPFSREEDGRHLLNVPKLLRSRLPDGRRIGYGCDYNQDLAAVLYQRSTGYLPLTNRHFTIVRNLELSGSALPDLSMTIIQTGTSDQPYRVSDHRDELPIKTQWHSVTEGQVTLLSWHARESVE